LVRVAGAVLAPFSRVVVPMCGAGADVDWLARQGHAVEGVELSAGASAVWRRAFDAAPAGAPADARWRAPTGASFVCADVWRCGVRAAAAVSLGAAFDALWERGAVTAVPPAERRAYLAHVAQWLRPGGLYVAEAIVTDARVPFGAVDGAEGGAAAAPLTTPRLLTWLRAAGLDDVRVLHSRDLRAADRAVATWAARAGATRVDEVVLAGRRAAHTTK
jgi:SAM-dependent methyltransferase